MREHHEGQEEGYKKCYTIAVSQCKNQENKIQWKEWNKDKHRIGGIAEEWNLLLKDNEVKKSLKLKKT